MTKKDRFKKNIRMIEIEQHSYCNRKCWFCPNQFINRQFKPVKFLDAVIHSQIIKDLASIDYDQIISFSGNCEPFSFPEFFIDRVSYINDKLPKAFLMTNTNTDYLSFDIIKNVAKAGLDVIKAQLYFDKEEDYTKLSIIQKMDKLKKKLPDVNFIEEIENQWYAMVDNLIIHAYSKNWHEVGHNRCDVNVRKTVQRFHVCGEPIQYIGINYAGQVTPCCNIRPDYEPYKNIILGQLDDVSGRIFELYQGVLLPETIYPCSTCMGKNWHANGKLVYENIRKQLSKEERK